MEKSQVRGVCIVCRCEYGGEFDYPLTRLTDEEYAAVPGLFLGVCAVCADGQTECDDSLCGDCPVHCSGADVLAEEKKKKDKEE